MVTVKRKKCQLFYNKNVTELMTRKNNTFKFAIGQDVFN